MRTKRKNGIITARYVWNINCIEKYKTSRQTVAVNEEKVGKAVAGLVRIKKTTKKIKKKKVSTVLFVSRKCDFRSTAPVWLYWYKVSVFSLLLTSRQNQQC